MKTIFKSDLYKRKFGVELEVSPDIHKLRIGGFLKEFESYFNPSRLVKVTPGVNGWDETNSNNYWHVKYDSTCGPLGKNHDHGWEIASFIGRNKRDLEEISLAGDWLKKHGVSTNDNCGYHIHVDISDFSSERVALLIARWLKIEFFMLSACESRRTFSPYCASLHSRVKEKKVTYDPMFLTRFWDDISPTNLCVHDNYDKRYTINTIGYKIGQSVPSYSRKTVEFRFPECSLSKPHISNWVKILLCFVNQCYESDVVPENIDRLSSIEDALKIIGLKGEKDFYLLSRELLNTKLWFLHKIKKNCINQHYAKQASELINFLFRF